MNDLLEAITERFATEEQLAACWGPFLDRIPQPPAGTPLWPCCRVLVIGNAAEHFFDGDYHEPMLVQFSFFGAKDSVLSLRDACKARFHRAVVAGAAQFVFDMSGQMADDSEPDFEELYHAHCTFRVTKL